MRNSTRQHLIAAMYLIGFTLFICLVANGARAQTRQRGTSLTVGTIKDYPATGLMTGCGNLYFFKAGAKMSDSTYVFLARGDGSHAWMNLAGRDVRLRQIKSTRGRGQKSWRYSYSYGQTRISVVLEDVKPKADGSEPEHMFKMTITIRRGSTVRIVHAVGDSDC